MKNIERPQLVIFDLYGTLIKLGVMHHPFRQLLKLARANGRKAQESDAQQLMTINGDIFTLANDLGVRAPHEFLLQLQSYINEELASLTLFEDVVSTFFKLESLGIKIGICSNLAQPYGAVINNLLSEFNTKKFLSYQIGFIKPEPQIYQHILDDTGLDCKDCLFIGDTYHADYEGPIKAGFQARHLIRGEKTAGHEIGGLSDILRLIKCEDACVRADNS
jgi:HAD superfamily hydrolase (TIGR01549 family)